MGKILTAAVLEARAAKRKAREVFLAAKYAAALTSTTLKAYVSKGGSTLVYVRSIEDNSLIVKMPVLDSTITKIGTATSAKLGWMTATEVAALTASTSVVKFKSNHQQILRIKVDEAKASPTSKISGWGTRVVDPIEISYRFPYGLGADTTPTLQEAKDFFRVLFTSGEGKPLIAKKGSYASLIYGKTVIDVVR
jgi:hypothetical protein